MRVSYFDVKMNNTVKHHLPLPTMGMRIMKTAVAVFICFIIYLLRDGDGELGDAVIASILCMQQYTHDSIKAGKERWIGTAFGAFWGLTFLSILKWIPGCEKHLVLAYLIIALGVAVTLYSTVLMKIPYASALAAITFLCITMAYPDIVSPLLETRDRLIDTLIGVVIGLTVNTFTLPRIKHPNQVFFLNFQDLVSNRMEKMSNRVLFSLGHLYEQGAYVCLMTHWAPAFLVPQIKQLKLTMPMIVMGGAAMYDVENNQYIRVTDMEKENVQILEKRLKELDLGYSIYTVRNHSMMIYHENKYNPGEECEYLMMSRSPYRNYMTGMYDEQDKIIGIQVLISYEKFDEVYQNLVTSQIEELFCIVCDEPYGIEGYKGIYFKSQQATFEKMKIHVMEYLHFAEHTDVHTLSLEKQTGHAEADAMKLLNRIRKMFEPITLL